MDEEHAPRPRGRPATGQTAKRNVRLGAVWDRAEELALDLARRAGKVRLVRNRESGEMEEKGDITAYVERALLRENARVERELRKQAADDA